MDFAFDPAKAASNLAKHGIAFDAVAEFDFATALVRATSLGGEPRLLALGAIGDRLHALVYTVDRGLRIISLRKANNRELLLWERDRS